MKTEYEKNVSTLNSSSKMDRNARLAIITSLLGWTLVNIDNSFFTFSYLQIMDELHLSINQISYIYTFIFVVGAVASFVAGPIMDNVGRKWVFQLALVFTAIGSVLSGISWSFASLLGFRSVTQVGASTELMAGQVMVAENTPNNTRGWWIGFAQIGWPVGWFIASLLSMAILPVFGWRVLFFLGIVPVLFVMWARRNVKESERFAELEKVKKAQTEVTTEYKVNKSKAKEFTYKQLFSSDLIRTTVLVTLWQLVFNIGVGGIISWLPSVFMNYKIDETGLFTATAIATGVSIIGYLSAAYLGEKFGRREIGAIYMLIGGIAGYFLGFHATDYTSIVIWYSIFYFFGVGSQGVNIAFSVEVFPTRVRGSGSSLVSGAAWLGFILAGLSGPIFFNRFGVSGAVFIWTCLLMVISLLCALGCKRVKPGASLEEIAS
ncbi:MFS transporter [Paenibacillus elgii]|uniref:MFS transporter n=1 Tax=Paenibacillus elgii TaxID=189691 RepID=UPI002D7D9BB7|nr:MFS transporter [Paenibacillus elgii]